jgi:hypothetical protein
VHNCYCECSRNNLTNMSINIRSGLPYTENVYNTFLCDFPTLTIYGTNNIIIVAHKLLQKKYHFWHTCT